MIRTLTRSNYDHVAMVVQIPLDPHKLHFIESVSNSGVRLQTWDRIRHEIGSGKHYKCVVYRSVEMNRDQDLQQTVDNFVNQAIGHDHNLTSLKLLKRLSDHRKFGFGPKSHHVRNDEQQSQMDQDYNFEIISRRHDENVATSKTIKQNYSFHNGSCQPADLININEPMPFDIVSNSIVVN